MVCKNCGSVLKEDAKFCENCGSKVEIEENKEVSTAAENDDTAGAESKPAEPEIERVEGEEIKPEHNFESTDSSSESVNNDPDFEKVNLETPKNGYIGVSIASLVCGILSIICCCCSPIGVCCSIAAIVTGIISLKNEYDGKGMAIAGLCCGGVGALFLIFSIISSLTSLSSFNINQFDFDSIDDFIESL